MNGGTGVLILSIDLELDLEHQQSRHHQRLDEVRGELLELTQRYRIPATWAVADPSLSVATDSIRAAEPDHEVAVLGDQAWLGLGCGRARLARELARRFAGARQAGISVSTLALRHKEQTPDLDLLLEQGVTALRGASVATAPRQTAPPPIRYGIWQPPAGWQIPPGNQLLIPRAWRMRREIRRAVRQRSLLHLHIDAQRLVTQRPGDLAGIDAVLRYAAAKRSAGLLTIATICQLAKQALAQRASSPAHSILKPAA